jgi:RNA polymerase sigma factor (sigma-70 family)
MATAQLRTIVQHLRRLADTHRAAGLGDAQLLEAFVRRRDEAAFAALLCRHAPLVYGVCRRVLGNAHDAEDAFQATFLVLVRKAGSIRTGESCGCWLYEIAYRTALRARAAAHKRRARERRAHAMNEASPKSPPETTRVDPLLDEELNRLPEQYRRPLVLCYLEGKTHAEAAERLGWPKGTVSGRLARARDLLRRRLSQRGVVLTAAALTAALSRDAAAAVPAPLLDATLRAGMAFAAGRVTGGAASAEAVTLAKEVLNVMVTNKLRLALIVLAAVGLLGGALAHFGRPGPQPARGQDREPLPAGATARMGSTAFRHGDQILYLAYTPDGRKLVTASVDGTVRLWDAATGRELRRFDRAPNAREQGLPPKAGPRPPGRPFSADTFLTCLSADGKHLAASRGDVVILWDLESGRELHRFRGSADGALLAFADGGKALLLVDRLGAVASWDVATGKPGKGIPAPPNPGGREGLAGAGPAVSGDGKLLAVPYSDPQNAVFPIRLIDRAAGKELSKIEVGEFACSLAFSPDGQTLAAGTVKGEVKFWDVTTGKGRGSLKADRVPELAVSLAFAPSGRVLALSRGLGPVEVWDVKEQKRLHRLLGTSVPLQPLHGFALARTTPADLAFSPDGKRLAVGAFGCGVRLFDPATGKELGAGTAGHRTAVRALGLSSDGKTLVTYARGDAVRFWDLASGKEVRKVAIPGGAASAALSPDGATLASVTGSGATGFKLMLYDTATGRPRGQQLRGSEGLAPALAFSPDGRYLAARGDRRRAVRLWDAATGKELPTPEGEELKPAEAMALIARTTRVPHDELAFSPDGRYLAMADSQDQLALFEVASGARLRSFVLAPGQVVSRFGFAPDGHSLAALNRDGTVTLYETTTGRKRARFGKAVKARGDGPTVFAGGMPAPTAGAAEAEYGLAFSSDGRLLAAGGPGPEIRLWDVLTGQELGTFRGHQGGITSLAFTPDGKRLISGSLDSTALAWDMTGPARALCPERGKLADGAADRLWAELAGEDAERAFAAIRALCDAPADAVALLKQRLRPVDAPDPRAVAKLLQNLNAKEFAVRSRAMAELEKLGDLIGPAARRALEDQPMLEARQRLEQILKKLRERAVRGEALAALRGVEVLEHLGTAPARQVLQSLAEGAAGARLTEAAREALRRLKGGVANPP